MKFVEAGLPTVGMKQTNWKEHLIHLQRIGIYDLIFQEFFALKALHNEIKGTDFSIGHLHVVSRPNRESVKMLWDILKLYESFTLFIHCEKVANEKSASKDALYQAFSLTDEVGCVFDSETIMAKEEMIKALLEEFEIKRFLIQNREGLLLPEEITRLLMQLRMAAADGSQVYFLPNNKHGLGVISALYAMREEVDGIMGSAFQDKDARFIDLMKLFFIYRHKKEKFFSQRSTEIIDRAFEFPREQERQNLNLEKGEIDRGATDIGPV